MKRKFEAVGADSFAWRRGRLLGKGGCGSVYLAYLKPKSSNAFYPLLMAVKSAEFSLSRSLRKEKEVFDHLRDCSCILECYGEENTVNNKGRMVYNLLLEYASRGTLFDLIRRSGGCGLPESDMKRYTRSVLKGIDYIHCHDYVHCDLKPENVLLAPSGSGDIVPKIGDFGLTKKVQKTKRGEPLVLPLQGVGFKTSLRIEQKKAVFAGMLAVKHEIKDGARRDFSCCKKNTLYLI